MTINFDINQEYLNSLVILGGRNAHRAELELRTQRIGERARLAAIGQATDVDPIGRLALRR